MSASETAFKSKDPMALCGRVTGGEKCTKIAKVRLAIKNTILYLHRCEDHWNTNPNIVAEAVFM